MINILRRKRWGSWKVIPVEVSPLWLIPQSIISKIWRFCWEIVAEKTFFWLHPTFHLPPWHFQTCCQCGSVVTFQKHSSLQNASVQICEAGKGWKKNLSNMKALVKHVMRVAVIENWNDLVVTCWSPRKVVDLYVGFRHFFAFTCLTYEKRRLYDTMSWKTYFNV